MSTHPIRITVNGVDHELDLPPRLKLSDLLRDRLGLTATHLGCEHGACGACTVRLDGEPALSCLTLAVQADGRSVETLEGAAAAGELEPLQRAFQDRHGLQCGFCTPGILLTVQDLLARHPQPSRDQIVEALGGHLCRCTGYVKIIEAVEQAARGAAPSEVTA